MDFDVQQFVFRYFLSWSAIISRLTGLILYSPFFGGHYFPPLIKVLFVVFTSYILIPVVGTPIPLTTSVGDIVLIEMLNFTFGFAAGLVANILFWAVDFAGDIYGYQLGFSAATIYDPQTETESVILSQMTSMGFLFMFVLMKGPLILFQVLVESFRLVPLTIMRMDANFPLEFSTLMGNVLIFGLQIGIPMIFFMILVTFVLGIMSKLLPQLNVFIVGLPLKVLVGMIILVGLLPIWADVVVRYTRELTVWMNQIFKWF